MGNTTGRDRMVIAVKRNDVEALKEEMTKCEEGGTIDLRDTYGEYDYTLLHYGAKVGAEECVRYLVSRGADINQPNSYGYTPLHLAVREGPQSVVPVLVGLGAHLDAVDDYGDTPLHLAALCGRAETGMYLVEEGANYNIANKDGGKPIHYATTLEMELLLRPVYARGMELRSKGCTDPVGGERKPRCESVLEDEGVVEPMVVGTLYDGESAPPAGGEDGHPPGDADAGAIGVSVSMLDVSGREAPNLERQVREAATSLSFQGNVG
mmetsp:Transcript_29953/g.83733  ORF Transcript_29953/g.83733 Transcript_29953/m.83733 type:complete len:266 (+) Transcript_29953:208-1005(+)